MCSGARNRQKLAFVSTSRDHKKANLRVADAATGAISDVYEETSPTQFESGQGARQLALSAGVERIHLVLRSATAGDIFTFTISRPAS